MSDRGNFKIFSTRSDRCGGSGDCFDRDAPHWGGGGGNGCEDDCARGKLTLIVDKLNWIKASIGETCDRRNPDTIFELLCETREILNRLVDDSQPPNSVLKQCIEDVNETLGECPRNTTVCSSLQIVETCVAEIKRQLTKCAADGACDQTICEKIDALIRCIECKKDDPSIRDLVEQVLDAVRCEPSLCEQVTTIDATLGDKQQLSCIDAETIVDALVQIKKSLDTQAATLLDVQSLQEETKACLTALATAVDVAFEKVQETQGEHTEALESIKSDTEQIGDVKQSVDTIEAAIGVQCDGETVLSCLKTVKGGIDETAECLDIIKEVLGGATPVPPGEALCAKLSGLATQVGSCAGGVTLCQGVHQLQVLPSKVDDVASAVEDNAQCLGAIKDVLGGATPVQPGQGLCAKLDALASHVGTCAGGVTLCQGVNQLQGLPSSIDQICNKIGSVGGSNLALLLDDIIECTGSLKSDIKTVCSKIEGIDVDTAQIATIGSAVAMLQTKLQEVCTKLGTSSDDMSIIATLRQIDAQIKTLQTCLSDLKTAISVVANDISAIRDATTATREKVCAIDSCVAITKDTVQQINTKLTTWDSWFHTFSATLSRVETKLEQVCGATASNGTKIDSLTAASAALCTKVESLQTQAADNQAALSALGANMQALSDASAADSACIKSLSKELAALSSNICTQQAATNRALISLQDTVNAIALKLAECCCGEKSCCAAPAAPDCCAPEEKPRGCGSSPCGFGLPPSGLLISKNATRISRTPQGLFVAFLLTVCNSSTVSAFEEIQIKDPIGCIGQNPQSKDIGVLLTTAVCFQEILQQCEKPDENYQPTTSALGSQWTLNANFSINPADIAVQRSINLFADDGLLTLMPGDTLMFTYGVLIKDCGLKCLSNSLTTSGTVNGAAFPCFSICESINCEKCTHEGGQTNNACGTGNCGLGRF